MMDLDEAIQHCKEQVQEQAKKGCYSCAEEHQQLAEWLRELKAYREQTGDAISRQAVLDAFWKLDVKLSPTAIWTIHDMVKHLPSVTPQQRTGRWILQPSNKEQGERDFIWWKCSECNHVIYSETEQDRREYHAYCGRCGAKMEVEE